MKKRQAWFLIVIGILLATDPPSADELRLSNGDVITGKVIRMEDQKVVFKTEYAGEISVDWQMVVKLSTDEPINVILNDGTALTGATQEADENNMTLDIGNLEEPAKFELKEVKAINPVEKPPVRITARANVGITLERGNTDTDNRHLDGELVARTDKNRFIIGGEINKEKDRGQTSSDNWRAYGKYNYFMTRKWFLFANTLFESDKFKDLDLRTTLGAGVGHNIFESEELNLNMAVGPAYIKENFIEAQDKEFGAAQWIIRYDQYFFNQRLQLFHNNNGYWSLSDSNNWLIYTRQGFRFPLYKGLTATFQYNYDYDNEPSEDAEEKWDSKLLFLLGWQFRNWQ
jgi:putative salt-induced outer membrane protein YdiY